MTSTSTIYEVQTWKTSQRRSGGGAEGEETAAATPNTSFYSTVRRGEAGQRSAAGSELQGQSCTRLDSTGGKHNAAQCKNLRRKGVEKRRETVKEEESLKEKKVKQWRDIKEEKRNSEIERNIKEKKRTGERRCKS